MRTLRRAISLRHSRRLLNSPPLNCVLLALAAEGRNLETEDGAPVVFDLEELADMGTPEGVEEIHNVLGR